MSLIENYHMEVITLEDASEYIMLASQILEDVVAEHDISEHEISPEALHQLSAIAEKLNEITATYFDEE